MALEKAIIHAEAVAKTKEHEAKENRNHGGWAYDDEAKKCSACAAEHRQLAEWLKELKERREKDVPETNVGDMISRKAAIDALLHNQEIYSNNFGDDPIYRYTVAIIDNDVQAIANMPSAQPEIIRCKDCKWWSNDDYRECSSPNYDDGYVTPAGFYCGYAERRTDELGDS